MRECPLICRVILVYYKLRLEKRFVNGIDEKAVNSIYVFFSRSVRRSTWTSRTLNLTFSSPFSNLIIKYFFCKHYFHKFRRYRG